MPSALVIPTPAVGRLTAGAALDVSNEQPILTCQVGAVNDDDDFRIESSQDGVNWATIGRLQGPNQMFTLEIATNNLRAVRLGGSNVTVGIISCSTTAAAGNP